MLGVRRALLGGRSLCKSQGDLFVLLVLLRELVPGAARVAVLVNPAEARRTESTMRAVQAAAQAMALQIQVLNANTDREIEAAFNNIGRERPDALFIETTPFLNVRNVQLAMLAAFLGCSRPIASVNMPKRAGHRFGSSKRTVRKSHTRPIGSIY